MSDLLIFDAKEFKPVYKKLWNEKISSEEQKADSVKKEFQRIKIESKGLSLILSLRSMQLPKDAINVIGYATERSTLAFRMNQDQINKFINHKAYAVIEAEIAQDVETPQNPMNMAWFVAQIILAIYAFKPEFIGYVPISSQMYHPKEWLDAWLKDRQLTQADLFILLGNIHHVNEGGNWIHTHGMEQFGQPDIEIRFDESNLAENYIELISSAAMYSIESNILEIGHTLEMNSTSYQLVKGKEEPKHKFGEFGVIALQKK